MKHSTLLIALLATAVLTAAPASAQNLAGTWEITSETGRGTRTQTLTLTVDGMTLTGTVSFRGGGRGGGGGGGGPQSIEISDGTIEGSSFTFTVTRNFGGNDFSLVYAGTFEGNTIEGTIEGGRGGGRPFKGKRAE